MPEIVITTKLSRREVLRRLRTLPKVISGRGSAARTQVDVLMIRLGLTAQKIIYDAFKVKVTGGRDASGLSWPLLAPYTVYAKGRRLAHYRGKKDVKANKATDILVELTDLRESLKPALPPQSASPTPPKVRLQVFRLGRGVVTIGTRRRFALAHHEGRPLRKLPQRRLWPEPVRWPGLWVKQLGLAAARGAIPVATELVQGAIV